MIAGYVLTGGKNKRMNGKKKLFLTYKGMPFHTHIFQAFRTLPITYLSVEAEDSYKKLQIPMVRDLYPDIGPIGGIYSGLLLCPEDALFVTACDMPLIDQQTVEYICDYYQKYPDRITIAKAGGRLHPLFGIYPKSVIVEIEQMILEKNYKMMELLDRTEISVVELSEEHVVRNVNTPQDYMNLK